MPLPHGVPAAPVPLPVEVSDAMTVLAARQPQLGRIHVDVRGEVDLLGAPRLARVLRQSIRAALGSKPPDGEHPCVVCDLDQVTFFGARGAGVLVSAHLDAQACGVDLAVVAGRGPVRRVLELTGLDALVTEPA